MYPAPFIPLIFEFMNRGHNSYITFNGLPLFTIYCPGHAMWVKVRDVLRLLRQDGWEQVRMKGSHRQFRHSGKPGTVTVAGKPGVEIPIGTLKNIFKQAGLKYD